MIFRLAFSALFVAFPAPMPPASNGAAPAASARWDAPTHFTIAAIAYERLQPTTRARVDSLLRLHPDLDSLGRGLDFTTPAAARELFMRASIWPDRIRQDRRFYDESNTMNAATPLLPGYPDMQRHTGWHYMNQSFSTDGTPSLTLGAANTVTQLAALTRELGDHTVRGSVRAYDLAWIVHIVSDLHQPLHGTSRASRRFPKGDAGGNAEWVQVGAAPGDTINLHWFWDGVLTRANPGGSPIANARTLVAASPVPANGTDFGLGGATPLEQTLAAWTAESATLARYVVYEIDDRADGAAPSRTSPAYQRLAESVARQRATLAGYRLAALLEMQLASS